MQPKVRADLGVFEYRNGALDQFLHCMQEWTRPIGREEGIAVAGLGDGCAAEAGCHHRERHDPRGEELTDGGSYSGSSTGRGRPALQNAHTQS